MITAIRYTQPMASIYIYSPSSTVRDKAAFKRGVKRLKALGHTVDLDEAALAKHMRFAGDDATRVAAIGRAAASGADVVLTARGGYGLTRILQDIDYKAIAKSIDKGTKWVGLSDFGTLQAALLAKTGAITWAGPAVAEDFGCGYAGAGDTSGASGASGANSEPDDIMEACFDDLVCGIGEGTGWRMPLEKRTIAASASKTGATKSVAARAYSTMASDEFTVKNAILWGGNLCVLTALVGTPYLPKIDKGILFFEDVSEHPYRIERMLTTWLNAGILQKQKAIVLGQFSNYKLVKGYDSGYTLQAVVDRLRTLIKVPIFNGLPFGHVPTKVCLPVGAKLSLHVQGRDAMMLWGELG